MKLFSVLLTVRRASANWIPAQLTRSVLCSTTVMCNASFTFSISMNVKARRHTFSRTKHFFTKYLCVCSLTMYILLMQFIQISLVVGWLLVSIVYVRSYPVVSQFHSVRVCKSSETSGSVQYVSCHYHLRATTIVFYITSWRLRVAIV